MSDEFSEDWPDELRELARRVTRAERRSSLRARILEAAGAELDGAERSRHRRLRWERRSSWRQRPVC